MPLRSWIRRLFSNPVADTIRNAPRRVRLVVEEMEVRITPATITVNSLLDNTTSSDGLVTLREALAAANANTTTDLGDTGSGADTIQFAASLFTGGAQTIDLSIVGDTTVGPSALAITSQITISGPNGANGLTIARDLSVSNLRLFLVGSSGNLTLDHLTLSGGRSVGLDGATGTNNAGGPNGTPGGVGGDGGSGRGGAIFNQGSLSIQDSTLGGNTAQGGNGGTGGSGAALASGGNGGVGGSGQGGAIFNDASATLTITNSTLSNNSEQGGNGGAGGAPGAFAAGGGSGALGTGQGGAVFNNGTATITSSTLSTNASQGGSGQGGAIYNNASIVINNSTFSGNTAQGGAAQGGAVFNNAAATISNTTLSNNTAQSGNSQGGAIFNGAGGTITVVGSTLSGNTAQGNNGGNGANGAFSGFMFVTPGEPGGNGGSGQGGGLFNNATATLINSTLSGNTARGGNGGNGGNGTTSGAGGNAGSSQGGGIFNNATVTVTNSTLSGNTVQGGNGGLGSSGGNGGNAQGGAVFNSSSACLTNANISSNTVQGGSGGAGGNGTSSGSDLNNSGSLTGDYNLIQNTSGWSFSSGGSHNVTGQNPLLTALTSYGGTTQTRALLPGSPAIDAGTPVVFTTLTAMIPDAISTSITVASSTGMGVGLYIKVDSEIMLITGVIDGTTLAVSRGQLATTATAHTTTGVNVALAADQRGVAYVGTPDIGAFESSGFTIAVTSGSGQSTYSAFGAPLVATVTANNPIEPVQGGKVTFTPPSSGASANLSGTPATISALGAVSVTATANGTAGSYSVSATASGITTPADFSLTNLPTTTVSSIVRMTPSGQSTNADSVTYTVTFADPTPGLTASNFHLTGTAGISDSNIGTPFTSNGGSTWTVTITGLANANGTLILNMVNATGLTNPMPLNIPFAGQTYTLDSSRPTITGVTSSTTNGAYGIGSSISIQMGFSEVVNVIGVPTLALNSGGTASYASGSGTNTLTFTYTIAAGQNSADLDYTSTSALSLGGGTIQDAATNDATLTLVSPSAVGSLGNAKNIVIDTTGPTITGVTSSTPNGTYGVGSSISIQVGFSEVMNVMGVPTLALNSGGTANFTSGSGTNTLTFTYIIAAAQNSTDLDYTSPSALSLSGGTIQDMVANSASLTLPAPGGFGSLGNAKHIVIDTTGPTITGVTSSTPNGTYGVGSSISIQVSFSTVVNVQLLNPSGTATLALNSGGTASYTSGDGTNTLTFIYTVGAGQDSANLDYTSVNALTLSNLTIQDDAANNASLTLPTPGATGSLGANKDIAIATTGPTITGVTSSTPNAAYDVGSSISIQVGFSQVVFVTGTPTLALNSGGTASYTSGSGTNTLTFTYTVGSGETSADLDYTDTSALSLSGGTIHDAATNDANLTLATPGAVGSLGNAKDLVIAVTVPRITGVTSSTPNGTYGVGSSISIQVSFSTVVNVQLLNPSGTATLALNSGGTASYTSGDGTNTLTFIYTVGAGQDSANLDYTSVNALTLSNLTIQDAVGTNAALALPTPGAPGSLGTAKSIAIAKPPVITSANHTLFTVGTSGTFAVTTTPGVPAKTTLKLSGKLPTGVNFKTTTGVFSGTPRPGTAGAYPITITASNGSSSTAQSFTLQVSGPTAPATIVSAAKATFVVGTAGTFTIGSKGFPFATFNSTTLPAGLTFTDNGDGTATISGTPQAGSSGSASITITANNPFGTATKTITLAVNQPPAITSASSTIFSAGSFNTFTVTTTGFPVVALSKSGTLPSGVKFINNKNGTATLMGTPDVPGTYLITITASNGMFPKLTQQFTLTVT